MRRAVLLAIVLGACAPEQASPPPATPAPSPPSPPPTAEPAFAPRKVRLRLEPIAEGFEAPLFVTHAGDGSGRIYVVEQGGTIEVLDTSGGRDTFLDIAHRVSAGGERGLLGLAFHPDDPTRIFVNHTDRNGDTVIAEYAAPDPERADPRSQRVLLRIDQPFSNHNGGWLGFGPDGHLYAALGDGGGAGDPHGNGQRLDSLLGKILRLDVAAPGRHAIPADNPYASGGGRAEIWASGLRNPWRASFDPATSDLWVGDVGQNAWEEVTVLPGGTPGGANLGWNAREGRHCFLQAGCDTPGLTDPVTEYRTSKGCAVTGGYVYRGTASPALAGGYLFADYCGGQIWALSAERAVAAAAAGRALRPVLLRETGLAISSFGEDEAGEVYVTDLAGGGIYRVAA